MNPSPPIPPDAWRHLQWLFSFHVLTIRQKLLAISQKYYVNDDQGRPRFYVVRPPKIGLSVVAGIAGLIISLLALFIAFRMIFGGGSFTTAIVVIFAGRFIGALVTTLLRPYRDIRIYTDDTEQYQVFFISQDNKFGFFQRYTIFDAMNQPVAVARRNFFLSAFRRTWWADTLDGRPILKIHEDSLLLSILRRYLGPLWGALRTNFDLVLPNGARIGEYNRKLTLTDQYMLDLSGDPWYLVDRRVALAVAILLDTGEGR